ncbi:MAG: hypothetical protein AB1918_04255 [Pseudomonadota bacterium]
MAIRCHQCYLAAMLVNGIHLLPDLSGALAWPKERLVAVSDPIAEADTRLPGPIVAETVRRLASVLRQRRPRMLVWLGGTLPHLIAEGRVGRREMKEIEVQAAQLDWVWVADDLPAGLPGRSLAELAVGDLVFRHAGRPDAAPGEVSASPWPAARADGTLYPCFVVDGRRLVIPPFGGRADGADVLSTPFQPLFRRPFQVLMLMGGRIVTRPRHRLDGGQAPAAPAQRPSGPAGKRISLFGD